MSEEAANAGSSDHFWVRLYGRWLLKVEQAIILVFLTVMVLGATLVLFDAFEDGTAARLVVFAAAFHLCLFGAVIATRRTHHIAVDAITPRFSPKGRRWVEGVLLVVSGLFAVYLTFLAYRFVFHTTPADKEFLAGGNSWVWNRRLWYAPAVIAFGWMALHFLVIGAVRVSGRDPVALGLTGTSEPGDDDASSGEAH